MKQIFLKKKKNLFDDFEEELSGFNLIQLMKFPTWSKIVGLEEKSLILDHAYLRYPMLVNNVTKVKPYFEDHVLLLFCIIETKPKAKPVKKKLWRH